jgi:hypothetical protein
MEPYRIFEFRAAALLVGLSAPLLKEVEGTMKNELISVRPLQQTIHLVLECW